MLISLFMQVRTYWRGQVWPLFLLFFCCLWEFSPAHAAELKVRIVDGRIIDSILEGEIRPGDYDRLVQQIHKGGLSDILWLNSPGGDAFEAMKIGRLIRELRMTTHAPDRAGNKTFCLTYPKGADLHQCNCASACFLIFVAGVNRTGNHLGVHRVFPRHERLKSISPDEAAALQRVATREVSNYLKEMGVPTHFIERLVATPSDQIEWVKAGDIERHSLIIYQHFPRINRNNYIASRIDQLRKATHASTVFSLSTSFVCFFVVPQRKHILALRKSLSVMHTRWGSQFALQVHLG